MKTIVFILAISVAAVASLPRQQERIVGGSVVAINSYPFAVSLQLTRNNVNFNHQCGGTILNNRAMFSAAHCWVTNPVANRYRVRSGSTNRGSGGWSHNVVQLFGHPQYNNRNHDNDVGVVRVSPAFQIGAATVRVGAMAGPNLVVPDNANVIALGWGLTSTNGAGSEQLRHVGIRTVNQARCNADFGGIITANMLCATWPGGGRGTCFGDSGTGLVWNNVVVGISSFIGWDGCGSARWPSVFARVSRYNAWIRNHA
ncbi:trypsin CFT-1-like [Pararge aegeria]|uniref:Jg22504 protein n=1 Tax=Pararge aegeria aegeria TaxID=348720 RepID=A0A8S4R9G1_9NEOP|nr:trypsin CFT-1-like [Pararge aegeria]CAH2233825.1 jg22504 [Pararge aegeria aegeria]